MSHNDVIGLVRKKRIDSSRRLVLVDIENVVGGSGAMSPCAVVRAQRELETLLALTERDHVVIASGTRGFPAVGFTWQGPRYIVRAGIDGADHALLDVLENERVAERFSEVVLVSGDGIFTDVVAALGAEGVTVTVVSRPEAYSKRLRMAASGSIYLESEFNTAGGAA